MDNLNDLLGKRINKLGLNKSINAAYIIAEANKVANGRFEAIRLSRGILTLKCQSPLIAQEIQFQSHQIIETINQKITPQKITRLSYIIEE